MNIPIDHSVVYDIINSRIISSKEQIVFSIKRQTCFDDEDLNYYKVVTVDEFGTVRKYYKECLPGEVWHQIREM